MAQPNPLPERLAYLQPFRKQFASRPDELNEDTGYLPLLELLQKRIAGCSDEAAAKLLEEDIAELQKWLGAPEQVDDCLHFAAGVFLIAAPADLIRQIEEESKEQKKPLPWVEMDLPPKANPSRFEKEREGGMLVKWSGLWFSVSVISDEQAAERQKPSEFWDTKEQVTCTPVRFGEVTGLKHIGITQKEFALPEKPVVPCKRIIYILAVPGGHVKVSIDCIGKRPNSKWDEAKLIEWRQEQLKLESGWDESPVESFFHTLRITLKQPSVD